MVKIALACILSFLQLVFGGGDNAPEDKGNELNFGVFADIHSSGAYFDRVMNNIFALTSDGEELDGVIMVGDILYTSETATPKYEFITSNKHFKELSGEGKIAAAMGNHEFPLNTKAGEKAVYSQQLFEENMGVPVLNDTVWGGYHFITVSANTYSGYYTEQEAWAMEKISAALAESENKPVFLFIHHPIDNTLWGSRSANRNSTEFENFLKSQPRLVVISGHNHYTNSDPHSIYQVPGGATFLYTSVVYTSVGQSMSYADVEHEKFSSQALMLSVNDKTNVVTVKRFYVDAKEPTYLEGGDWTFDIPRMIEESRKDVVSTDVYKYTEERQKTSVAPYFSGDAKISVDAITDTFVNFSFPEAKSGGADENSFVAYYKLEVLNAETGEKLKDVKIINDFFVKEKRDTYTYGFYEIPHAEKWRIKVTPVTTWYVEGEPLILDVAPAAPLFSPATLDAENTRTVSASEIKAIGSQGHFTQTEEYINLAAAGNCTLRYTFKAEKTGTYRLIVKAAAQSSSELKMTFGVGNDVALSKDIVLGTGSINTAVNFVCADIEIEEPGEYTIKLKKTKTTVPIRVHSITFGLIEEVK